MKNFPSKAWTRDYPSQYPCAFLHKPSPEPNQYLKLRVSSSSPPFHLQQRRFLYLIDLWAQKRNVLFNIQCYFVIGYKHLKLIWGQSLKNKPIFGSPTLRFDAMTSRERKKTNPVSEFLTTTHRPSCAWPGVCVWLCFKLLIRQNTLSLFKWAKAAAYASHTCSPLHGSLFQPCEHLGFDILLQKLH